MLDTQVFIIPDAAYVEGRLRFPIRTLQNSARVHDSNIGEW